MKTSTPAPIQFLKLAALLLLCTTFALPSAHAQGAIKMLPPTNCPFITQAQIAAGVSNVWGVLGWDSKNPLSCVPNFQFADNGYTGIGSAGAQPQALLDLFGDYNYFSPNPTIPGVSHLGNIHMDPTDNVAPTNDGWGTAITFGGDAGYDASAEAGIYVQYSYNTAYPEGGAGTKMYFGTTNNYATGSQIHMTIDNLGNVGIGTTAPQNSLQIGLGHELQLGGDIAYLGNMYWDNTNNRWSFLGYSGATAAYGAGILIHPTGGMGFYVTSNSGTAGQAATLTNAITILANGNVGIGMTSPAAPLDVNGGVRGSNSSVIAGAGCSAEGMLGYDMTHHGPVYCSQSGIWTSSTLPNCSWISGSGAQGAGANCPSGQIVMAGGCDLTGPSTQTMYQSYPSSASSWYCGSQMSTATVYAYALCCH